MGLDAGVGGDCRGGAGGRHPRALDAQAGHCVAVLPGASAQRVMLLAERVLLTETLYRRFLHADRKCVSPRWHVSFFTGCAHRQ